MKNTFLILAGLASVSALAQTQTESTTPPMESQMPLPMSQLQEKTANGITYVCGGIGTNEAEAMKQTASDYDMMITFAASNGAYLADVNVDIADARGESVLKTTCNAPIMLVDFEKNGNYRVRAEVNGHAIAKKVQVRNDGKVKTLVLVWPVKSVDMGTSPAFSSSQSSGSSGGSDMGDSNGMDNKGNSGAGSR